MGTGDTTFIYGDKEQKATGFTFNQQVAPPLPYYHFDTYEAYALRINSFIDGAQYALIYLPDLSDDLYEQKKIALDNLRRDKRKELDRYKKAKEGKPAHFESELQHFYYKQLPEISGLDPKQLALAEAFHVWQETERPKRCCKQVKDLKPGELIIEQIDIPRNEPLTAEQKSELIRIHRADRPQWFHDLPEWAQRALQKIVPKETEGDWKKYEKCRPATLRHIPGEANASTHQLRITHKNAEGESVFTYSMERQATPTSYQIKDPIERQHSANENLKQMLDFALLSSPSRGDEFKAVWDIDPTTLNKLGLGIPVLIGSLLTPIHQAGFLGKLLEFTRANGNENNTELTREKFHALMHYPRQHPQLETLSLNMNRSQDPQPCRPFTLLQDRVQFPCFFINVPVNILGILVKPQAEFVQFLNQFCQITASKIEEQKQNNSESKSEINQRLARLQTLQSIHEQLQTLDNQKIKDRNRNLYLAALYDVSTRLMAGLSTFNCMSNKDRSAHLLIMASTILTYCAEQQAQGKPPIIPAYSAQGPERQHFVEIFCDFYLSGHHFLLASDNSPGAAGLKDGGVLDQDIVEHLQSMRVPDSTNSDPNQVDKPPFDKKDLHGAYAQSEQVANFNKPGSLWQKYREKIGRYAAIASIFIFTLVALGLTVSGVLNPLAIIVPSVAAHLGTMAIPVGLVTNISLFALGGACLSFVACAIKDIWNMHYAAQLRFRPQFKKLEQNNQNKAKPSVNHDESNSSSPAFSTPAEIYYTLSLHSTPSSSRTTPSTSNAQLEKESEEKHSPERQSELKPNLINPIIDGSPQPNLKI